MMRRNPVGARLFWIWSCFVAVGAPGEAADWPMWRFDAARSAASPEPLAEELHPLWQRVLGPRKPAWDDALNQDLMTYDRVFEPVVKDGRVFLGCNDRDRLVAYDLETGTELWSYFADGPVRLAPVAWRDRVFFACDDGRLYCLGAADGRLHWTFRGGPNARRILGNQRLISAWPMRGGPVVRDDIVYCAAGIWPFMGTFIYALDADSGRVIWVNDETGAQYIKQPHSAPSFAGVAPQGALVATADMLLVPGGRSVPAALDRHTGTLRYFELNAGGKGTGGSFLAANDRSWFVHTRLRGVREFVTQTGVKTDFTADEPVLSGEYIYAAQLRNDRALVCAYRGHGKELVWEIAVDGRGDLILAGDTLFAAGSPIPGPDGAPRTTLTAIRLPRDGEQPRATWTMEAEGTVERLVAAGGKLLAVTREGNLLAYGAAPPREPRVLRDTLTPLELEPEAVAAADRLLAAGSAEGYALWLGAAREPLVTALAARSPFVELSIFDEDRERIDRLRRALDAARCYGRVTARHMVRAEFSPPPYVANMLFVAPEMVPNAVGERPLLERLFESVRPYGGVLYLLADADRIAALRGQVAACGLERAEVTAGEMGVVVRRVGPLPGAGSWTHQYGNVANTIKSDDRRVKLPLGVLWFGGVSHDDVLPRHGHGPPEQVIGGRLFIQGINSLTARDVYTGRVLWRRTFQDLGSHDVYFDDTLRDTPLDTAYNQVHIPGANARGTNYVVTSDRVYVVEGAVCHVLDPATGDPLLDIALPQSDPAEPHAWGYVGVSDDVLLGGVGFAKYRARHNLDASLDAELKPSRAGFGTKSLDRAASLAMVAFDRYTGKLLWRAEARHSFWHNGIVAGGGRVYALDRNPKPVEDALRRRGQSHPDTYRILAVDLHTGEPAWDLTGQVFGTWLGYSPDHDLLLQAGAAAGDRLTSEVTQGMAVYRGRTGSLVWKNDDLKYSGPCVLHGDLIITNANSNAESAGAFHLADGSPKLVENAITGELRPWRISRAYGCNSIIAGENLLTFRSGAAGFYDLLTEGGTGNFGGFRSGCTANLVAADGVLNAPDYTRTCSCAYQNQTSLALVHMPELDAWTVSNADVPDSGGARIRRLGINLGAPGDRRDPNGLMWLEYPAVAGDSLNLELEIFGAARPYQDHPTFLNDAAIPWVASSGLDGLTGLRLGLNVPPRDAAPAETGKTPEPPTPFRVRLHFGVPRNSAGDERTFRVAIAGQPAAQDVTLGGAASASTVMTIDRVLLGNELELTLTPIRGRPVLSGIELQRLDD